MVWCVLFTPANEYVDDLEENFFFDHFHWNSNSDNNKKSVKLRTFAFLHRVNNARKAMFYDK